MSIQILDKRYTGSAIGFLEGAVVKVQGTHKQGWLWWSKTTPVWVVKIVITGFDYPGGLHTIGMHTPDRYWRTVAILDREEDADQLLIDLKQEWN